jgi:hypothetical protein
MFYSHVTFFYIEIFCIIALLAFSLTGTELTEISTSLLASSKTDLSKESNFTPTEKNQSIQ